MKPTIAGGGGVQAQSEACPEGGRGEAGGEVWRGEATRLSDEVRGLQTELVIPVFVPSDKGSVQKGFL